MCAHIWAQESSKNYTLYTEGVEVGECTSVCLYNIGAHRFLTDGMDWGTHAAVDNAGRIVDLSSNGGNYSIHTYSYSNADKAGYMTSNGYLDTGSPDYWTFETVTIDGYTNVYKIRLSDTQYLTYNPVDMRVNVTSPAGTDVDCWIIVPLSERMAKGDYTFLIQNSEFNRPWERKIWQGDVGGYYPDVSKSFDMTGKTTCIEHWNSTFNTYQEIKNVPNGFYRLKVQGLYRIGKKGEDGGNDPSQAALARSNDAEVINAYFYANGEKELFPSIFDNNCTEYKEGYVSSIGYDINGTKYYVPTNMERTSRWFFDGAYETSLVVEVTNGTLTIGAKNEVANPDQWAIFDNFRLEYLGEKTEPALEGFLYTVVDGQKKFLTRGDSWNTRAILGDFGVPVKVTPPTSDGKTKIKFLDSQLFFYSDGQGALYTNANYDFRYYRTQFIITGNEAEGYELQSDNRNYKGTIGVHDGYKLSHETTPLKWHFMSMADYEALIASRNLAYRSAGYSVEELNKIPATVVKNANDTQTATRREFFDVTPFTNIEQDRLNTWSFTGLAKGLYKVNVKAFYRAGDIEHFRLQAAAGYDAHLALLRANNDYVQIGSILSSKKTDNSLGGSTVNYNNTTYYVPQSMDDADTYFNAGYYDNVLYTNVGDDGKLDISIVCDGFIGAQWLMFRDLVISRVETDKFLVDINEYGASTFSSTRSYQVPTGLEAWYASACDGKSVFMTKIEDGKIPANTGVVLTGEKGQHTLTLVNEASAIEGTNLLVAVASELSLAPTTGDKTNYILKGGKFHPFNGHATVAAGKAYLQASSSEVKNIVFDDETTGINAVSESASQQNRAVFNLAGQSVGNDYKGIVIMNGKKVYQR